MAIIVGHLLVMIMFRMDMKPTWIAAAVSAANVALEKNVSRIQIVYTATVVAMCVQHLPRLRVLMV